MRKRSEVELRVAQELKNHQDFIYQTNQALQNLKLAMEDASLHKEQIMAKFGSDKKSKEISIDNVKADCDSRCNWMEERIRISEKRIADYKREFEGVIKAIEDKYMLDKDAKERFAKHEESIKSIERKMDKMSNSVDGSINQLKGNIAHEVSSVRNDLTPIIPEVCPIKKAIEDGYKSFKVDFDGLMREIAIIKKKSEYQEKKIENIYTLIERSREGRNVPGR